MSNLEALLLGVVQGLTEFLPISSSGHLILVPWLQDYHFLQDNESFNKTFDVALHAGTLVAVLAYFRTDDRPTCSGLCGASLATERSRAPTQRLAWAIVVGTIPAVIAGGLGESFIEDHLGEPWQISILLIVCGLVLGCADRRPQRAGARRGRSSTGPLHRPRPGPRAGPRRLALGHHDHRRPLPGARPRRRRPLLVPPPAPRSPRARWSSRPTRRARRASRTGVAGPMIVGTIAAAVSGYLAIAGLLALVRRHSYDALRHLPDRVGVGCC